MYTKNSIDNETAYRITNINFINNEDENYVLYTLNGIFDFYKLNNKIYHNNAKYMRFIDSPISLMNT